MRPSAARFPSRLLPILVVAGCASEVRRADDDGAGGAAADVATVGSGIASTSAATTSATSGTGAFDLAATCIAACDHECVGGPMTCFDACTKSHADGVKSWCDDEWAAAYACQLHDCVPGTDCTGVVEALVACDNVHCKDFACAATADGCACSGKDCEEGHTRLALCRRDATGTQIDCDCYENDVLVTACIDDTDGCYEHGTYNCCDEILRNGNY